MLTGEQGTVIPLLIPLDYFLSARLCPVKAAAAPFQGMGLDRAELCRYGLNKRNKQIYASSSRCFCRGVFHSRTCMGMLLERRRYLFIWMSRSV